ncbi:MAG TPA: DUF4012 domain-containing protein [Acidimicrobiales bacterium]|nr:DUF4012 domain-containing protein [Acidimicrobiales bacterium]
MVGVVLLWLVGCAALLAEGVRDASHGASDVQEAKNELSASDVVSRSATAPLRAAARAFDDAGGYLHSPVLAPLDILPVIGRQLRSVQDLASASAQVATIGIGAVGQAHGILHAPHATGPERVQALRRLAALASSVDGRLLRIDTGPSQALVSPLAAKHATFLHDLDQVEGRLQHASSVAGTLAGILQGPKTYLLLMANNAEMRAGSGDYLEVGALTTDDGELHLSDPEPTVAIPVPAGEVNATGDLEARWGWIHPGQDWRNLGFTPQFDVNAALAARMWEAETGQHVDGALAVDVEALHQFLEATGPVTLPDGSTVSADNVVQLLVHDQYEGLSDILSAQQDAIEAAREESLGSLAKATLDALQDESLDLTTLSNAMTSATQGRHLLAWSADPTAEKAWVSGGVAGELEPDSAMAAVINRGGNKLDQYLGVSTSLTMTTHGKRTEGVLTVDLANRTPPGQSQFIAGPYPGLGTVYGEYVGVLAVNLPGYASAPRIDGSPPLDALGAEGPTWLVATNVDVKEGATERFVIRFTVPLPHGSLAVVPTARLDPVQWHYRGRTHSDASAFTLSY